MRKHLLFLLIISTTACTGGSNRNHPELETIHYPTAVMSIGDSGYVLVSNTGLDRKYDKGHLSVVNASNQSLDSTGMLTGLFGGGMALSEATSENGERFLLLPTRDNDLLELFALSAERGVSIRHVSSSTDFGLRPMQGGPLSAVALGEGFMVSHPSSSYVSYWYLDTTTETLTYGCSALVTTGTHMLAKHPSAFVVYASSRLGGSMSTLRVETAGWVGDPSTRKCRILVDDFFSLGSRNSHGLAFNGEGSRLYVTSLADGVVSLFDTSLGLDNQPLNVRIASRWLGPNAGLLRVSPGDGDVYIAVTDTRQIVRLDAESLAIKDRIHVSGRPYDFDFAANADGERMLVASYYTDHKIGFIQLDADGMTEVQVLEASP